MFDSVPRAHSHATFPWNGRLTAVAFAIGCLATDCASAQQTAASTAPDDAPSSAQSAGIQQVVVTAQKRKEMISDVPSSISAISGSALEGQHIVSMEDITRATPGVSFGAGANPGMDSVTIRGVSSQGGGATVGLYLDDVPITTTNPFNPSYSGATEPTLLDVDRVEILRGPQGTLYGAGSMGGTIRYIYKQPDAYRQGASITADVSGTNRGGLNHDERAVFNMPLVDGVLSMRGAVEYNALSGYIDHYTFVPPTQAALLAGGNDGHAGILDRTKVNSNRTLTGRLGFGYEPNDNLKITLQLHGQGFKANDTSIYNPAVGVFQQDKLVAEPSTDKMFVPSLSILSDLGWSDFTSVTSYFWRKNTHQSDGTYFNSDFIEYLADAYYPDTTACGCGAKFAAEPGPSNTRQTTQTTSQEIRFVSKPVAESKKVYSWIGGLFFTKRLITIADNEYVDGIRQTFLDLYQRPPETSGFADAFANDSVFIANAKETERQYAAFGDADYKLTSALKVTGGLRYMAAQTTYRYDESGYFAQGIPPVVELSNDYHAVTPKASIDYKVDESTNVYASAAKGYRLGGYIQPIQTTVGLCVADLAALGLKDPGFSYKSDSLWSYEAGSKSSFLANLLSVNLAAYYIDWRNVQQSFSLSCGSPYTANFGSAVSKGGELEVRAKVSTNLTLGLDAGVNHAVLTQVQPNVGASVGQFLLNTPKWTTTLSADYDWHPMEGVRAFVHGDYDWVGSSFGSFVTSSPSYRNPAYGLLNMSFGTQMHQVDMSAYIRNLLNSRKVIQQVSIEQTVSAYTARPLTAGVSVTAHF